MAGLIVEGLDDGLRVGGRVSFPIVAVGLFVEGRSVGLRVGERDMGLAVGPLVGLFEGLDVGFDVGGGD